MSEFKGTPGPWRFSVHDHTTGEARGTQSAFVQGPAGIVNVSVDDALLIAAAPELLDALQDISEQYRLALKEIFASEHQKFIDSSATLKQAVSAISKATGAA